jgi:beta-galactosidase/beta-glucuronidase
VEGSASSAPVSTRDAGRPAAATGGHRLQRLEGRWSVAPDPGNEGRAARWCDADPPQAARPAPVPGIIAQAFPGHRGVAWYWHTFTPAITPGLHERALLRFGAVDYLADVWLNGTHVGGHEGAETPFLLEVTGAVRAGAPNRLVVRVLVPTDEPIDGFVLAEVPHRSKRDQGFRPGMWLNFGGILGDVDLLIVPAVRIADVFVRPEVATGRLVLAVTVQNDAAAGARGWLTAATGPAASVDTEDSVSAVADFPPGESAHELTLAIQEPRLWSPDDPFLYRVTTTLGAGAPAGGAGRAGGRS